MKNTYVLDACALIAAFTDEPGHQIVRALFQQSAAGEIHLTMHKFNLLEVYYDAIRRYGLAAAESILAFEHENPVYIEQKLTNELFREAGRLKTSFKISIADSIALAEASVHGGYLVTSDHHEFDAIEQSGQIKFHWIR